MLIVEQIKKELVSARKSKDQAAVNILSLVLGEIQMAALKADSVEVDAIIKKVIKSNNITLESAGDRSEVITNLKKENEILQKFLPQKMTIGQIEDEIKISGLELDSNVGKSMGKTIKMLKEKGLEFDSKDVNQAIKNLL